MEEERMESKSREVREKMQAWFDQDEDRLSDAEIEEIAQAVEETDLELVRQIRQEMVVELVAKNIQEMPDLSFHDIKNLYPYPSSDEVNLAKVKLDPSFVPKARKKH